MEEKVRKIEEMSEVDEPGQKSIKTGQGKRKKKKPDRSRKPDRSGSVLFTQRTGSH